MFWLIVLFIPLHGFSDAQKLHNNCVCDETEDYSTETTECIGQYTELESYIMSNTTLVGRLAETFFTTGKTASKFVKITYNFQTKNGLQSLEDSTTNCSRQQSTYVWGETGLYLLAGPKAIFWFTLFAVNIAEADVAIELPCLCNDVYNNLLSRLTYLVCSQLYKIVFICLGTA